MKKISNMLLLCSLLTCNSYNFSMQDDDIEADNNIIASEILYALETLSPANNETIEQRHANLLQAYHESPYSILTSASTSIPLEHQAQKELQHINHAYQIMQKYNLINKTSTEIEDMLAPFLPPKEQAAQLNEEEALDILDLSIGSSWAEIADKFATYQQVYESSNNLTDEEFGEVLAAYNFLQEKYDNK